jgi:hypothetical protein
VSQHGSASVPAIVTLEDALVDYELGVDEQFEGRELDRSRWLPFYLPQWAGRDRSRAHYRLVDGHLELFIAEDQLPWLPDIEPDLRVSSLQTGCFAGPVGSSVGQHRTNVAMTVVEDQPVERLITPMFGVVELRARWNPRDDYMVALWMIGFEEEPDQSAEICVCEIFGSEAATDAALIGMGIRPFGDPALTDDFEKIPASIDISEAHDYAALWTPHGVTFYIDGQPTKHTEQAPQYPMQLMLNIYDFGGDPDRSSADPFIVDRLRIHQLRRER